MAFFYLTLTHWLLSDFLSFSSSPSDEQPLPFFPTSSGRWPFPSASSRCFFKFFVPSIIPPSYLALRTGWRATFLHCNSVTCDLVTQRPRFMPARPWRESPRPTSTEETAATKGKQKQSTLSFGRLSCGGNHSNMLLSIVGKAFQPDFQFSWDHDLGFCVAHSYFEAHFTEITSLLLSYTSNILCFFWALHCCSRVYLGSDWENWLNFSHSQTQALCGVLEVSPTIEKIKQKYRGKFSGKSIKISQLCMQGCRKTRGWTEEL